MPRKRITRNGHIGKRVWICKYCGNDIKYWDTPCFFKDKESKKTWTEIRKQYENEGFEVIYEPKLKLSKSIIKSKLE